MEHEYGGENPDFDFVPLLFTLQTQKAFILRPVSVVAGSCFNDIGPRTCFQLVLDRFRSF